jgi:hypothetical protein
VQSTIRLATAGERATVAAYEVVVMAAGFMLGWMLVGIVIMPFIGHRRGSNDASELLVPLLLLLSPLLTLLLMRLGVQGTSTWAENAADVERRTSSGLPVSERQVLRFWLRRSWLLWVLLGYLTAIIITGWPQTLAADATGREVKAMLEQHRNQAIAAARWLLIPTLPLLMLGWWDSLRVAKRLPLWKVERRREPAGFEVVMR